MEGFAEAGAGALLIVDLGAIAENWRRLAAKAGGAACGAAVKADAYGLGAEFVAPALWAAGCRAFFVAHFEEAARLRPQLDPAAEIFILHGVEPGLEEACVGLGALPVLNSLARIDAWRAASDRLGLRLGAALQVDSGMSRMGLSADEVVTLANDPARLEGVNARLVMSHLACADEPAHPANRAQLASFRRLAGLLPEARRSLANSSGIFLGSDFHLDLVRPGAALYGVNPTPGAENPMRAVVTLAARVIQTREIAAGAGVGYGLTFGASAPMRLATLSIGYADGFPRAAGAAAAFRDGARLPLVGRVSMDSIVVDLSGLAPGAISEGDLALLTDPTQTIDDIAAMAGTIGYETLARLGRRFHRRYVDAAGVRA